MLQLQKNHKVNQYDKAFEEMYEIEARAEQIIIDIRNLFFQFLRPYIGYLDRYIDAKGNK